MSDLTPGSPEWCRRVSPSKVAAILGLSPWDSPYSMWRKMRGEVPWDAETPAMERGTLCEPAVLAWWRKHHDHHGWQEQVTTTIDDWCVATPDAETIHDGAHIIVEAKTAASDDNWGDPGTDQVPTYYLAQAYFAAHVLRLTGTDVKRIHMPVLFGTRLRFENYVIAYDEAIGSELFARCRDFYDTLAGDPPPLDGALATYEAIRKVHAEIERGESVELTYEEARDLVIDTAEAKRFAAQAKASKSVAYDRMGRAQYATHNGVRIARRQAHGDEPVRLVVVAKPSDLPDQNGSAA